MKRNWFFVEHLASFIIEVIQWLKLIIKMFKIGFRLSKYVIEGLELRLFYEIRDQCFHSQNIKFSPVSLRPRSRGMHSYVLSNGQKHFVSHMFAMLQRWYFRTRFTFKLYGCKPSSLLYNAKNSQPQFIFWTRFLFNLSLYDRALEWCSRIKYLGRYLGLERWNYRRI